MVIKISTTGEVTPIEIDGKRYGLKSKLDLSLSIQHQMVRLGTRMKSMDEGRVARKKLMPCGRKSTKRSTPSGSTDSVVFSWTPPTS